MAKLGQTAKRPDTIPEPGELRNLDGLYTSQRRSKISVGTIFMAKQFLFASQALAHECNEKKIRNWPVRLPSYTHPARAPEGRTSKDGVQIIANSLYSRSPRATTAAFAGRARVKWFLTVWVPRI